MSQLFGMDNILSSLTGKYENNFTADASKAVKNTIGSPELSKTATNYYEELKTKHSDVEFVLVDKENIASAKEQASNIHTNKSMVVLISEDEVEEMATNETVRTQNEKLITDAKAQMPDLLKQLKESGAEVKSFGMEFNDNGTASYFAVVDESMAAQKERIETKITEKRNENKITVKEEEIENRRSSKKESLTTITASSMEDLIQKIKDKVYEMKASTIRTEQEKMVGQSFDFTV